MAKRTNVLGGNLRDELLLHQWHALDHYHDFTRSLPSNLLLPTREPNCKGYFSGHRRAAIKCPICATSRSISQISKGHAPPKNAPSGLGHPTTQVMVCNECEQSASLGCESEGSKIKPSTWAPGQDLVEPRHVVLPKDASPLQIDVIAYQRPFLLTDFRAAYLLAFAVMGYRWAFSPEVRQARMAVRSGSEPDLMHGWRGSLQIKNPESPPGNRILEVIEPEPCLIVRGQNGAAVALPTIGTRVVPLPNELARLKARWFPWAETAERNHREVDKIYRSGNLFHGDFCRSHWVA